jgi:hypothetical protein
MGPYGIRAASSHFRNKLSEVKQLPRLQHALVGAMQQRRVGYKR